MTARLSLCRLGAGTDDFSFSNHIQLYLKFIPRRHRVKYGHILNSEEIFIRPYEATDFVRRGVPSIGALWGFSPLETLQGCKGTLPDRGSTWN
jgi:hypothetical protein